MRQVDESTIADNVNLVTARDHIPRHSRPERTGNWPHLHAGVNSPWLIDVLSQGKGLIHGVALHNGDLDIFIPLDGILDLTRSPRLVATTIVIDGVIKLHRYPLVYEWIIPSRHVNVNQEIITKS